MFLGDIFGKKEIKESKNSKFAVKRIVESTQIAFRPEFGNLEDRSKYVIDTTTGQVVDGPFERYSEIPLRLMGYDGGHKVMSGAELKALSGVTENAEGLNVGDDVIITGNVQFNGATGVISEFSRDKHFVIVDLYNHGKRSFHSSDVSINDYAGSDEEEARMYDAGEFRNNELDEEQDQGFFVVIASEDNGVFIGALVKDGGQWREVRITGNNPHGWGSKRYQSYLTPEDLMTWLEKDYGAVEQVAGPFADEEAAREFAENYFDFGVDEDDWHGTGNEPADAWHLPAGATLGTGGGELMMGEATSNVGAEIVKLYKKIYRLGDDAVDHVYHTYPTFRKLWDTYEGDLRSIVAEVQPAVLQKLYAELLAAAQEEGVAEGLEEAIPYALSAANSNAEFERTKTFVPRGYLGRVDVEVNGQDEYRRVMDALKRAAKAASQHVECGLSGDNMSVFSKTMDSAELDEFMDNVLERGIDEGLTDFPKVGVDFKATDLPPQHPQSAENVHRNKVAQAVVNLVAKDRTIQQSNEPYRAAMYKLGFKSKDGSRWWSSVMDAIDDINGQQGVAEGVAETLPMSDAVKVLRHYGADRFQTTTNELHFYKNGRAFSVDLVMNPDTTRSVTLTSLNSATRGLKGQGIAEGRDMCTVCGQTPCNCTHVAEATGRPMVRRYYITLPDGSKAERYEILNSQGVTIKNGMSKETAMSLFKHYKQQWLEESAAWQKKSGKNKNGGLNQKGVDSYRREHPGSKLQTAVTTKPSKLKPGSKDAKRRKSFCARMSGVDGPMKKPNGEPTRKALALRKWNCESVEDFNELMMIAESIRKGEK